MIQLELVAHRGYAGKYPENSLASFQAAINCGCRHIELDVQLTMDGVPIVIHDDNLHRTGDVDLNVLENTWSVLQGCRVGESQRFSNRYSEEKLPSLSQVVGLLKMHPDVTAFVELKEESISKFGKEKFLAIVNEVLFEVKLQCVIISFDSGILFYCKQHYDLPVGYVLHQYDEKANNIARQLMPDFIICNYKKIEDSDDALWENDWEWFLYEITDPEIAIKWNGRGVKYIETMEIESMMLQLKTVYTGE